MDTKLIKNPMLKIVITSVLMFAIIGGGLIACSTLYFNRALYENGVKTEKNIVLKTRLLQNDTGSLALENIGTLSYTNEQGTVDKNIEQLFTGLEKNKDAIISYINPAYALTLKSNESTTATVVNSSETEY